MIVDDGRRSAAIGCHELPGPLVAAPPTTDRSGMTRTLDPLADLAAGAARIGGPDQVLPEAAVAGFVAEQLAAQDLDGRSVCVVIPDATRSCPLPLLLTAVHGALAGRVSRMTVLVALGTHAPMTEAQLARHLGYPAGDLAARYPGMVVRNHEWADPDDLRLARASSRANASPSCRRGGSSRASTSGSTGRSSTTTSRSSSGRCSRTRSSASPAATSTSSRGSPARRSSTCRTGWARSSRAPTSSAPAASRRSARSSTRRPPSSPHRPSRCASSRSRAAGPCTRRRSASRARPGPRRPTSPPRRTCATSTPPCGGCCRSCPRSTTTSGPPPRASTSSSRSWPTAARSSSTRRTSPRSRRCTPRSTRSATTAATTSCSSGTGSATCTGACSRTPRTCAGAGTYDAEHGERCRLTVTLATGIPEDVVRAANLGYLDPAAVDIEAFRADGETFVVPEAGEVLFRLR